MSNAVIVLEILSGALDAAGKAQEILSRAAQENRDVTWDELEELRLATDSARERFDKA